MELTAIQQLINELDIVKPHSLGQVKLMAKHYLELEKQQIIDAFNSGWDDEINAEQYYNETFNSNGTNNNSH